MTTETQTTKLDITPEDLQKLLARIEMDFGFDYDIEDGKQALEELRRLVGGESSL